MNFYKRNIYHSINIYSTLHTMYTGSSFWADKFTGLPDPNYCKGLPNWNLHKDLSLLKVKELCVRQIWEF